MHRLTIFLLAMALTMPAADAHKADRKAQCHRVKQQIRKVESRMRQGYTRAQGERLSARLRELREKRYRLCR